MRVTVFHVLCSTPDIDISFVTVGQRSVEFTLYGPPPSLGCWGMSTFLSIPLIVTALSVPLTVTVLSVPLIVSVSLAEVWTEGSE